MIDNTNLIWMGIGLAVILALAIVFSLMKKEEAYGAANPKNKPTFLLEIVPAWFSPDYVVFRYSLNNGKSWMYIQAAESPLPGDHWKLSVMSHRLRNGDFDYERERFNSHEKIMAFEAKQREMCIKNNTDIDNLKTHTQKVRQEALNRANKPL